MKSSECPDSRGSVIAGSYAPSPSENSLDSVAVNVPTQMMHGKIANQKWVWLPLEWQAVPPL